MSASGLMILVPPVDLKSVGRTCRLRWSGGTSDRAEL